MGNMLKACALNFQQLMIIWSFELLQHLKIFYRKY